jgi:hypothetical protein
MQASRLFGIEKAEYVYAHQLWAACALYQATGDPKHWSTTQQIYEKWINPLQEAGTKVDSSTSIDRLFWPVPNYDNPVFFALMCMAQSSPSATGIETKAELELNKLKGPQADDLLLSQPPLPGTRLEVLSQLWKNLVAKWVAVEEPIRCVFLGLTPITTLYKIECQAAGRHDSSWPTFCARAATVMPAHPCMTHTTALFMATNRVQAQFLCLWMPHSSHRIRFNSAAITRHQVQRLFDRHGPALRQPQQGYRA